MKIKNLFTSIEITTQEMQDLMYRVPVPMGIGVFRWIKEKFGLELFPKLNNKSENNN